MGFAFAVTAALTYIVVALGSWTAYRQAVTNAMTVTVPVKVAVPRSFGSFATGAAVCALGLLTTSMIARALATDRPPLGNLWEYTVALGWGITLFTVAFEIGFKERAVSAVMMTVAATMMGIALVFFPSTIKPLVPALQSNRILGLHVTSMMLAYSALSISFGAAVLYLAQGSGSERRFARLPAADTLEDIGYWSVLVGFPLLTLGIALGAYWANSAWGKYWGWDPKETSALLTWFIYAGYLHARVLRGWEGKRSAYLLLVGFAAVMFTYFAVNFLISGLHSYAGV
ncbi:MAG TPA: c-type cytochrome biogenesis protein CcsB [Dehalococcoidia bacterium]